ncbi:hypothetical protein NKH77_14760 [Streptomyces sp. M19]
MHGVDQGRKSGFPLIAPIESGVNTQGQLLDVFEFFQIGRSRPFPDGVLGQCFQFLRWCFLASNSSTAKALLQLSPATRRHPFVRSRPYKAGHRLTSGNYVDPPGAVNEGA